MKKILLIIFSLVGFFGVFHSVWAIDLSNFTLPFENEYGTYNHVMVGSAFNNVTHNLINTYGIGFFTDTTLCGDSSLDALEYNGEYYTQPECLNAGNIVYDIFYHCTDETYSSCSISGDMNDVYTFKVDNNYSGDLNVLFNNTVIYNGEILSQNKINSSLPADNTTVNASVTFSGSYINDGSFDTVLIGYSKIGDSEVNILTCDIAEIGVNKLYSCSQALEINTSYEYGVNLWGSSQEFPSGTLADINNPYSFTTNDTFYELPDFGGNTCETFDIGCYLTTALQWLFIPEQETINKFITLKDMVINKPPFGYISGINHALESVKNADTAEFTLEQVPNITQTIFDPIRTGLIWVLWVAFAFILFFRFKNIVL